MLMWVGTAGTVMDDQMNIHTTNTYIQLTIKYNYTIFSKHNNYMLVQPYRLGKQFQCELTAYTYCKYLIDP